MIYIYFSHLLKFIYRDVSLAYYILHANLYFFFFSINLALYSLVLREVKFRRFLFRDAYERFLDPQLYRRVSETSRGPTNNLFSSVRLVRYTARMREPDLFLPVCVCPFTFSPARFMPYIRSPLMTHASQTSNFTRAYFFFFSQIYTYGRTSSVRVARTRNGADCKKKTGPRESPPYSERAIAQRGGGAGAHFMGNAFHHCAFILFRDLLRGNRAYYRGV